MPGLRLDGFQRHARFSEPREARVTQLVAREMREGKLSAVFHNYGDVFSGQAARLISLALSLVNRLARSARVNAH